MRMKKSFALLIVLLFSVSSVASLAALAPAPSILASTTSNGVKAQGNSWPVSTAVTLYFDVEDANHKVCQVMPDYVGSFVANFPLDGTVVGTHTIIAVQGANHATATFTVGVTSPPDDRLLNPITNKLDAIEAKLDAGGSFYTFVDTGFTNIETGISDVGTKVDAIQAELNGNGLNPSDYSMFLRIDGIPGGSTDPHHHNWIDVLSYSIGTHAFPSVIGTVRPEAEPFNITKPADVATPVIAFSVNDGSLIRQVELDIVDNEGHVLMKYVLDDVLILSDRQNGNAFGQTQPFEEVSFDYTSITWTCQFPGQPTTTRTWHYDTHAP